MSVSSTDSSRINIHTRISWLLTRRRKWSMNMTRVCVNLGKFDLYYICMHYGSRLAMVDDGLESIVLIDSKGSDKGKFNE